MKMDEKIIVENCQKGDRQAWNAVYKKYAGSLLTAALRYIPDKERAYDILHDAFIKIFSSIDSFSWRGEGSLKAWMTRIVINLALESLRKYDIINDSSDIETLPEDDFIDDDEEVERVPNEKLMEFIGELPDGYRTVFNLFVFEEKSHKEIAAMLGISEQTSASQYHRARANLAKKINEYLKKQK